MAPTCQPSGSQSALGVSWGFWLLWGSLEGGLYKGFGFRVLGAFGLFGLSRKV